MSAAALAYSAMLSPSAVMAPSTPVTSSVMPLFSSSACAPQRSRLSTMTSRARQVIHALATSTSLPASARPSSSVRASHRSWALRWSRLMAKTVAMAEASGPWWVRWALTGTGGAPRVPEIIRCPP